MLRHDDHLLRLLALAPPAAAHEDDEGEEDDLDQQDHEAPLAHLANLTSFELNHLNQIQLRVISMWRSVDGELLNVNNSSECTHTGKHCGREEAAGLPVDETVRETRASLHCWAG